MTRDELKSQLLMYEGIASKIYEEAKGHMPMVLLTGPDKSMIPIGFDLDMNIGTTEGEITRRMIRRVCLLAAACGAESIVFISEAWSVRAPEGADHKKWAAQIDEWRKTNVSFETHPNRVECLILNGACREGTVMQMFRLQRPGENGAHASLIPQGTFDECESRFVDGLLWGEKPNETWPAFVESLARHGHSA